MTRYIERIKYIDYLIRTKTTGCPKELAVKLKLSERMVYEYINTLRKDFSAPIKYSRVQQTYYYEFDGSIKMEWIKE